MEKSIIERFIEVHGNKYDYSKVKYTKAHEKVCIICPEHGEFWQAPHNHLQGKGCPECGKALKSAKKKLTLDEFIKRSKEVHGSKYDYTKVEYINNSTPVCIICPEHGEFWQKPSNHLRGKGCIKCSYEERKKKQTYTTEDFIKKAELVHGKKYDYSKTIYKNSTEKVCIICPEHGEFWQEPASHLSGCGCPFCSGNAKLTTETFISKAKKIHGDEYDYSLSEYVNSQTPIHIICKKHGDFWQIPNNHLSKKYCCPKCHATFSKKEKEIVDFVKSITDEKIIENDKQIISPLELDIYIPSLSFAIEFDGLRWHSEEFEPSPSYHLKKTKMCEERGIKLLHIFEDEWEFKKDIVKDIISNTLNKNSTIYARKCVVKEISINEAKEFTNANHIQGYVQSKINIGLFNEEKLVSVMTFGNLRINLGRKSEDCSYEMLRYSTIIGNTVIGGASKMFNYFLKTYNPRRIISYSDNRFFSGVLYEKLGFTCIHNSPPNYFYIIDGHRENRFKYRKSELIKKGFDANKTEHQIMLDRKIFRIYDCGCKVWEFHK